ncbi:putative alkaline shock family protein YloU [Knoellia remsis]|uniref:Putative alkaline shock family protein YloU n=1 Tax=Knoellia remsis TaxID=407159 RepID=A0A2T0UK09_9MICO|nr:Asp23/Gls24 family envelope stress response protein [Knoellia remsis]PRY58216.1 putative alkaline shock family protein YloU [Knoellia remsis]
MSNTSIPQTGQEKERAQDRERAQQEKAQEKAQERQAEQQAANSPLKTDRGTTTLDDTVVAKIAGMAAREVPGVYDMGNAVRRAFSAISERIPNAQTNVTGGITVEKGETQTAIDVTVVVEYGASILEVGEAIRRNVIEQVEGTTGLEVVEVNVNVVDVHLPQDDQGGSSSNTGSTNPTKTELQ